MGPEVHEARQGREAQGNRDGRNGRNDRVSRDGRDVRAGGGDRGGRGERGGRNRRGEPRTDLSPLSPDSSLTAAGIPGQERLLVNAGLDAMSPYTAFTDREDDSEARIPATAGLEAASDRGSGPDGAVERAETAVDGPGNGESATGDVAQGPRVVSRPRDRSRSSRGRGRGRGAAAAAPVVDAAPMVDRPEAGNREPGSDMAGIAAPVPRAAQSAKPQRAKGGDGRGKSADAKRRAEGRTEGRAEDPGAKAPVKAVEARIKTGVAAIPASNANTREPVGQARSEDADAPRRRSRRRSRRGKGGGSKDGAAV